MRKATVNATVSSVFVIGPDYEVNRTFPAGTGRNFDGPLRVIDSLQLTATCSVASPADGDHGQDVIIVPAVSEEEAKLKFPTGFVTRKPRLRITPQPSQ